MSPMFYPVLYNLSAQGLQVEPRSLNTYVVFMTVFIVLAIVGLMLLVKED